LHIYNSRQGDVEVAGSAGSKLSAARGTLSLTLLLRCPASAAPLCAAINEAFLLTSVEREADGKGLGRE